MANRSVPVKRRAWDPAFLELVEVSEIKAMARNHPRGFDAIVRKICRFYDMSFAAGGDDGRRESDYAEGKRAVGKNLLDLAAMELPGTPTGAPPED